MRRRKMEQRRSLIQRETEILDVCRVETKPTHLLYSTNLGYNPLTEITNSLIERELLEKVNIKITDKRTYYLFKTTQKGMHYVDALRGAILYGANVSG